MKIPLKLILNISNKFLCAQDIFKTFQLSNISNKLKFHHFIENKSSLEAKTLKKVCVEDIVCVICQCCISPALGQLKKCISSRKLSINHIFVPI